MAFERTGAERRRFSYYNNRMPRVLSQHWIFCYEVMPALFHAQTRDFFRYAERDGAQFLRFWWDHILNQHPGCIPSADGDMFLEVEQLEAHLKVVFLQMPPPSAADECYFLACAARPERFFAWVRMPTTRLYALRKSSGYTGELGLITPRGNFVPLGADERIEQDWDTFKQRVRTMMVKDLGGKERVDAD